MESNTVQVVTLTSSVPESASSTSHILNTNSNLINTANYSNSSLNQDSSSNFTTSSLNQDSSDECKSKRFKSSESPKIITKFKPPEENLEDRLWNVLCCAVCLELPLSTIYQCSQGHLICIQCFNHLLADARLKDEQATCASCRCSISRENCTRNLAVEKAIHELPGRCSHCSMQLSKIQLSTHENEECDERPVFCVYNKIGCPWRGPYHEKADHESSCSHPKKSGHEILQALETIDKQDKEDKRLFNSIVNLLSYEKVIFTDLQLKPYRTDEYVHRLFYETSKFQIFNHSWVIKARINDDQKDPTQSVDRKLTYQLVLKSKTSTPLMVHYLILRSAYSDLKVKPKIYNFEFNETNCEAPYVELPLINSSECNRLLASKFINFRLVIFQMPK